jgi:DNA-directed RNA polymerase specialized sigma24 family protein
MAVQSAVASLPRADRPLAQARLEGKTWQEIGEGLKVSRQAAQQRGARAEERLRRRLADVR